MSFGSGTICRGGMSANPGFGRSERKVACCEKCSATLVALKKQALSLAVHHHFSCKVSNHDGAAQGAIVQNNYTGDQSAHLLVDTNLNGDKKITKCIDTNFINFIN